MGPDEIGESRQLNHTPMIALGAAAVLLLIVCAMSYRDYVRDTLEKEFAEKEQRLMQRNGYYPAPQGQQQNLQPQLQQQPVQQADARAYTQQQQTSSRRTRSLPINSSLSPRLSSHT